MHAGARWRPMKYSLPRRVIYGPTVCDERWCPIRDGFADNCSAQFLLHERFLYDKSAINRHCRCRIVGELQPDVNVWSGRYSVERIETIPVRPIARCHLTSAVRIESSLRERSMRAVRYQLQFLLEHTAGRHAWLTGYDCCRWMINEPVAARLESWRRGVYRRLSDDDRQFRRPLHFI